MSDEAFIYFVQGVNGGPIKIGTSRDPARRLSTMNTGSPEPLELLVKCRALPGMENRLHRIFAAGRLHGEWFDADTPGLAEFIELQIRKIRHAQMYPYVRSAAA